MNTKNNRRAQSSRDSMKQALLGLLERMDILDVTVSRLCEAAQVNRSTFYSHYDSVADLMEEIEQEIGENLLERFTGGQDIEQFGGEAYDENTLFSTEHLAIVLEHIRENQNFYRAYFSQSTAQKQVDSAFGALFQQIVRPMMRRLSIHDIAGEYYFAFFKAGFLAFLRHWLENRCREEPEQILPYLRNMLSHPGFEV